MNPDSILMIAKKVSTQKIPKTFLVALGFALLFWTLIKLSKEYETVVSFPVSYVNIPQDKLIEEGPLQQIEISLKASGFKLFLLGFNTKTLELNLRNIKNKSGANYYFLTSKEEPTIRKQLSDSYVIDYFLQDTIHLKISQLTSKKVAVIGDFDLKYKLGYQLINPLQIEPDSIVISGPSLQVDSVKSLKLEKLSLNDIANSIDKKIRVNTSAIPSSIKFSVKEVKVQGNVGQFTEGTMILPFEIINKPDAISVNTFPKTVEVKYLVEITRFKEVTKESFMVVCDYQHAITNGFRYMIPKVIVKPDFVSSLKVTPSQIDFLIQN